ncbi:LOW QUALITY PROTEIN: transcription factor E4F1-like [Pecten maximus]|uniref:LOW QUALITY PROTEIN: transcription factor E4F1-like n=1 Tax=Pecten maximus TaxID=6579 RepID=UPI001458BF4A|nr:LOW QUALITY PROTEIN: transcription factor E4F1-like [Pecten maximus]
MSEKSNDTTSVVNTSTLEGFDTDNEGDEDIHFCKKCRIMFTSLEEYLQHKVKHDNFKVTFSRSGHDRRMVVPKLIQKQKDTSAAENENSRTGTEGAEKENTSTRKKKRGRKRKTKDDVDEVNKELVITDKPAYYCPKCDIKFNREATLRRHVEYVHDSSGDYTTNVGEEDGEGEEVEANIGRVVKRDEPEEDHCEDPDYKQVKSSSVLAADSIERRFECHICQNRFKEINVLKSHLLTHSNKRDFPCGVEGCVFAFKTKGSLKRHMRRHTGERPFSCSQCGRSFTESGALTRHMKSRIPCTSKSDQDLPRYGKRWSFVASQTSSEEIITTVDGREACELEEGEIPPTEVVGMDIGTAEIMVDGQDASCFEVVGIQDKDTTTILETPENVASTQCKVCKVDLTNINALRIHLRTHLADVSFRCPMCHYVTEKRKDLANHMWSMHQSQIKGTEQTESLVHIGNWTDDSLDKEKQTQNAKTAIRQMLQLPADNSLVGAGDTTTDVQNHVYRCSVCNKSFRFNANLRLHMKSHIGDRPHKCPHCDKCFVTKDTLCKHLSVHSEERQYKCGECGKLFKRISHVREHLKIHSSDRPFPCDLCDKSFKTGNAMKVHMRTHTNIMPYVCPYCRRHFREKGSLNRHVRMHTGEKPYVCKHCGKSFSEHGTLNRHLRAKVPCSRQLNVDDQDRSKSTYPTVLAEFSSVADTQQYITTQDEGDEQQQVESQTEYVVLQTDLRDDNLHNVEIVTDGEVDTTMLEGMQVTDDYIVVTDSDQGMKILDSKTGETIAMMPLSSLADGDNQLITMTSENEIEAVAMAPGSTLDLSDSIVEQAMMVANVEEQVETTETIQGIVDGDLSGIVTEEMIITSEAATNLSEDVTQ